MKTINIILSTALVFIISIGYSNAQFNIKKKELQKNDLVNRIVYFQSKEFSTTQIERYKKEVISIPFVNEELSELDLHFAINIMQSIMNEAGAFNNFRQYVKEINSNAGIIKEKTQLISEKLTGYSQEYLQQFYEEEIKVVPEKEILQAIHNQDGQYAYLIITIKDYSVEPSFNHIILDCAKNEPLLVYGNSTAYAKPCKHTCVVHHHNDKLEFSLSFYLKKYQKIINS